MPEQTPGPSTKEKFLQVITIVVTLIRVVVDVIDMVFGQGGHGC